MTSFPIRLLRSHSICDISRSIAVPAAINNAAKNSTSSAAGANAAAAPAESAGSRESWENAKKQQALQTEQTMKMFAMKDMDMEESL